MPGGGSASSTVSFASRSTNALEIDVQTSADGYLFLGDTYYPGWRAMVDGQETPVLHADYLFRAVRVPAGTHHIRMIFDPLSWKIGAALTGAGVVALLIGWWIARTRPASPPATPTSITEVHTTA